MTMNKLLLPYNGKVKVESRYGYRVLNGETNWHNGIDLVGMDSKIIISPCDGVVRSSTIITDKTNKTWEWGNYIRIDCEDVSVFLCHLSERYVNVGDTVKTGQPIGKEGNTGYSFGSHCHFETRRSGTPFDPTTLLHIYNGYGIVENEKILGHDWSEKSIKWAIENGILKGYSDKEDDYKLNDNVTREEMIVFLHRLYNLINGNNK